MSQSVRERVLSLLRPFFADDDDALLVKDPNNLCDDFARSNLESGVETKILTSDKSIAGLIARLEAAPPTGSSDRITVVVDLRAPMLEAMRSAPRQRASRKKSGAKRKRVAKVSSKKKRIAKRR